MLIYGRLIEWLISHIDNPKGFLISRNVQLVLFCHDKNLISFGVWWFKNSECTGIEKQGNTFDSKSSCLIMTSKLGALIVFLLDPTPRLAAGIMHCAKRNLACLAKLQWFGAFNYARMVYVRGENRISDQILVLSGAQVITWSARCDSAGYSPLNHCVKLRPSIIDLS